MERLIKTIDTLASIEEVTLKTEKIGGWQGGPANRSSERFGPIGFQLRAGIITSKSLQTTELIRHLERAGYKAEHTGPGSGEHGFFLTVQYKKKRYFVYCGNRSRQVTVAKENDLSASATTGMLERAIVREKLRKLFKKRPVRIY